MTKRTFRYKGDGTRRLNDEENLATVEARENIMASDKPGIVRLFNPLYPYFRYGSGTGREMSDDLIVFGPEPGVAMVPDDHKLLKEMLKACPYIEVIEPEPPPAKVYACPDCDDELGSKAEFNAHREAVHPKRRAAPTPEFVTEPGG